MNGGKLVDKGYAPTAKASWSVPTCSLTTGGAVNGPAGIRFLLVQDGPDEGIFERSMDGSGSLITNKWSDEAADHYFGWVQSTGWEYVIPKDPARHPMRLVYTGLRTTKEGQVTKPASPVVATCAMVAAN
jgi:hypothetical protein